MFLLMVAPSADLLLFIFLIPLAAVSVHAFTGGGAAPENDGLAIGQIEGKRRPKAG